MATGVSLLGEILRGGKELVELADRAEQLGPLGLGVLAWNALPQESRDRLLGDFCSDCGEPRSACECCAKCGFSPCACPDRFARDAEGVSID